MAGAYRRPHCAADGLVPMAISTSAAAVGETASETLPAVPPGPAPPVLPAGPAQPGSAPPGRPQPYLLASIGPRPVVAGPNRLWYPDRLW